SKNVKVVSQRPPVATKKTRHVKVIRSTRARDKKKSERNQAQKQSNNLNAPTTPGGSTALPPSTTIARNSSLTNQFVDKRPKYQIELFDGEKWQTVAENVLLAFANHKNKELLSPGTTVGTNSFSEEKGDDKVNVNDSNDMANVISISTKKNESDLSFSSLNDNDNPEKRRNSVTTPPNVTSGGTGLHQILSSGTIRTMLGCSLLLL
ncbi:hypothetical protein RFI_10358, partial [Reticulomyxa filosa]